MAILSVGKDVTLLGEGEDVAILSVGKDVTLLGEGGTWLY